MDIYTVAELHGEGRGAGTEADPLGVVGTCYNREALPGVRRLVIRGEDVRLEPVWPEEPTTAEFEVSGEAALGVLLARSGQPLWVREAHPGGALIRGRLAAWEGRWDAPYGLRLRLTLLSPVAVFTADLTDL